MNVTTKWMLEITDECGQKTKWMLLHDKCGKDN